MCLIHTPHVLKKVEKQTNMNKRETEVIKKSNCHVQKWEISSVQSFSCVWLSETPMDCSTPGFPVHYQLPELAQIHVHRVGDVIRHGMVMGPDAMILVFWMWSFKPTFSLSSFTFTNRLFSSSSLSAIRVSSAYMRLLIFLPAILIPACASSF